MGRIIIGLLIIITCISTGLSSAQNVNISADTRPLIISQLDLDMIYEPGDPRQTELNINKTIARLRNNQVNTVFLQAFSDPVGDGNVNSVYFFTTAAPVRANIFEYVAGQLRQNGFRVFAWMPTLACQWLINDKHQDMVLAHKSKGKGWYKRATPFSIKVRTQLKLLFKDLAMYSHVQGILFQDDVYLNDYEDFSPAAKAAFQARFGKPLTVELINDPNVRAEWTKMKTAVLTDMSLELMTIVKQYRPEAQSARNIYPLAVINPKSEELFAQNYNQYLQHYDYTVIMAYPELENQEHRSVEWLRDIAAAALAKQGNVSKVVFKIQTYDWKKKRWISNKQLQQQIKALRDKGAINIGYYPESMFLKPVLTGNT